MYYWTPQRLKELKAKGLKLQASPEAKLQAASDKQQATEIQASSDKHQAPSCKPQASSREQQAAQSHYPHKVSSS